MFLKSITLRGFKSFADKTVLDLEPGITVIVGPNGSGKSNIVDALSWVLGTHSAKSLRGGSMADVIYAGAPGRPGLGRAAVEITIDNAAGLLPIEFNEVTLARAMFATGETSYTINAVDCRALDIQELLSDTGLGRQNHTVVGQGQLDAILNARPEERRLFIEEAAGILKHRRRKERALRKLVTMEAHLERLTDVLRELRRSLRPLERQAAAAAEAATVADALRTVRIQQALRELAAAAAAVAADDQARTRSCDRLATLSAAVAAGREREAVIETQLGQLAPAARAAVETHFRLANLTERYRGLAERIVERRRGLVEAVEEPVAGTDPAQLRANAARERQALSEATAAHTAAAAALEAASEAQREAERARRAHQQAAAAEARRRAEDRERRLRWEGEVNAVRGQLAQAAGEEGRLTSHIVGQTARRTELEADVTSVRTEIQQLDTAAARLAEHLETAQRQVERRQQAADAAVRDERELERRRATLEARADTLRAAAEDPDEGAARLLEHAATGDLDGVMGRLADHLTVEPAHAAAVSAALGALADAVVVDGRQQAVSAIGFLRARGSPRVLLLPADEGEASAERSAAGGERQGEASAERSAAGGEGKGEASAERSAAGGERQGEASAERSARLDGARPLADVLDGPPGVLGALRRALAGVYLVADFETACLLAGEHPRCAFVSAEGEIAGARGYAGGKTSARAPVLALAAATEAYEQAEAVAGELLVVHRQVADADRELVGARHRLDAAAAAMTESDGLLTSAAERLRRLRAELSLCTAQLAKMAERRADLERETASRRARLEALEALDLRPGGGDSATPPDGPDLVAERLEDELADARERAVEARIEVNGAQQRAAELRRRIELAEAEAASVERRLADREIRRQARVAAIQRCDELTALAGRALRRTEASQALAARARDLKEEQRAAAQRELGALRARLRELDADHSAMTEQRHREDLVSQNLAHRLQAARVRLSDDLGLDPDEALAQADPPLLAAGSGKDEQLAMDEERLSRKLALFGAVNPLAVEEYEAGKERHAFLTAQLEDCRASKRDLLKVVEAVDERIREVFAAAFQDVAGHFERLFPRLFPGGEGRLRLTGPEDLLESGVEVEARPPGKRVKRLSLLSGGERSLCALAVLFAIFSARPSPFYVLDEVEAALDDLNLQRFLEVVRDFDSSQLLIVTHQKRTMEIADCLYGVTMQAGGVSKVVSQRISQPAPA